jgi:hypothetical protein
MLANRREKFSAPYVYVMNINVVLIATYRNEMRGTRLTARRNRGEDFSARYHAKSSERSDASCQIKECRCITVGVVPHREHAAYI